MTTPRPGICEAPGGPPVSRCGPQFLRVAAVGEAGTGSARTTGASAPGDRAPPGPAGLTLFPKGKLQMGPVPAAGGAGAKIHGRVN